jgi:hypothetical protein
MFHGTLPGTTIPSVILDHSQRGFVGTMICKIPGCKKILHFWRGNVVSAHSDLLDERLGEVLFRQGRLPLDVFIETAGKVTHETRFGDVLIQEGRFTTRDLWNALNIQSQEVIVSLAHYHLVEIHFEPLVQVPRLELSVQFHLEDLLNFSLVEKKFIDIFHYCASEKPELRLEADSLNAADHDFLRDMVSIVQEHGNYTEILTKGSRLTPLYTNKGLWELFVRGVISDTWGISETFISSEAYRLLFALIEEANFMFAELQAAVQGDNMDGWSDIVDESNELLKTYFGGGLFLTLIGFLPENIIRCILLRDGVSRKLQSMAPNPSSPDAMLVALKKVLMSSIYYILFELYNMKLSAEEFLRIKTLIDGIRQPHNDFFSLKGDAYAHTNYSPRV